jgi:hypothetical protein
MAEPGRVQWRRVGGHIVWIATLLAFLGITALIAYAAFGQPPGTDPTDGLISLSAIPSVVVWMWSLPLAFARQRINRKIRFNWALGCVLLWLHIAIAFHLGHAWSHRAAWEHTRAVGGYGDGVFVNYAFAIVWLIDAVWALVAFDSYRTRPGWLHWSVHGFLAFVMFNAAVVFGSGEVRIVVAVTCVLIGLSVWRARRQKK